MTNSKVCRILSIGGITRVYDGDGKDLTESLKITNIEFYHDAGDKPYVILTIYNIDADLQNIKQYESIS